MSYFNIFNILKFVNYIKNWVGYLFSYIFKKNFIYGKPSFASFELSSICNLKCPQCDVGNRITKRNNKFINFDDYCSIIDQIGPTLINAIFYFQGEPLLNKDFSKYVSYAKLYNIYAITSTNAQLINKFVANSIVLSGLDKIIISVDGTTEDTYNKYRIGGSLPKVIEAIGLLKSSKIELNSNTPKIEAQFIVFSFNEHQIDEFKHLYKVWGADSYSIKSAQICNPNKDFSLIPKNEKYSRYKFCNDKWILKKNINHPCIRAWSGLVISSDENILPCCFDKTENHIYGNFRNNNNVISIWKSNKANDFRKNLLCNRSKFIMCRNCNE